MPVANQDAQGCGAGTWHPCVAVVLPRTLNRVPHIVTPTHGFHITLQWGCAHSTGSLSCSSCLEHGSSALRQHLAHLLPAVETKWELLSPTWAANTSGRASPPFAPAFGFTSTSTPVPGPAAPRGGFIPCSCPWGSTLGLSAGFRVCGAWQPLPRERDQLSQSQRDPGLCSQWEELGRDKAATLAKVMATGFQLGWWFPGAKHTLVHR